MNRWFRFSRVMWKVIIAVAIFMVGGCTATHTPKMAWGVAAAVAVAVVFGSFLIWVLGRKSGPIPSSDDEEENP